MIGPILFPKSNILERRYRATKEISTIVDDVAKFHAVETVSGLMRQIIYHKREIKRILRCSGLSVTEISRSKDFTARDKKKLRWLFSRLKMLADY